MFEIVEAGLLPCACGLHPTFKVLGVKDQVALWAECGCGLRADPVKSEMLHAGMTDDATAAWNTTHGQQVQP